MRRQSGKKAGPAVGGAAVSQPIVEARWIRPMLLVLAGLLLLGLFSKEISNTDFWWQLKTGEFLWHTHSLPDPDPFAYTTAGAGEAYAGEAAVRHFNLTHEWLAQVLLYLVYRAGGFGAVVLGRATLLAVFCALVGVLTYRRSGHFYRALAATFAAAAVVVPFAVDRPYLVTFVLLTATLAMLEWRQSRFLWLLPVAMVFWANSHGGFFLGWVAMAAWSAEAAYRRLRGRPEPGDVRLWTVCAISILVSGLNPNGFKVIAVLFDYRKSFLTSRLFEWAPARLWPPSAFNVLLVLAALVLLLKRREVRLSDWLLFAAFAVAGLMAGRNEFLIGLIAPVLLAAYLPGKKLVNSFAQRALPVGATVLLAAGLIAAFLSGRAFQLRAADWAAPAGAADFLLANRITQPMLNTYEYGGYLIWKLWPQERVFIDGRALSEAVFNDNQRMMSNAGNEGGANTAQLLDKYGIEVVVMNPFEYISGVLYMLAPALAEMDWKLVYAGADAMVFLRHPPPDMAVLDPSWIRESMESGCQLHVDHEPDYIGCAYNMGHMFLANGEKDHALRWLGTYLAHAPRSDPKVTQEYQQLRMR